MTDLDYGRFDALTFDCYGTLIDWEAGILAGLRPVLAARGVEPHDDEILEVYAAHEAAAEAGPYMRYREILGRSMREVAFHYGIGPDTARGGGLRRLGRRLAGLPRLGRGAGPTPRTVPVGRHHELRRRPVRAFRRTPGDVVRLGRDRPVGAEPTSPIRRCFEVAFERIGLPRERILHVAQSLFHDHVPAKALGLTTVWIDRRHDRPGSGATPPAAATPDATFPDMASFAEAATRV